MSIPFVYKIAVRAADGGKQRRIPGKRAAFAVRLREGAVDGPDEDGRDHDGECDGGGERAQEHAPQDEEETARARPTGVRRVL